MKEGQQGQGQAVLGAGNDGHVIGIGMDAQGFEPAQAHVLVPGKSGRKVVSRQGGEILLGKGLFGRRRQQFIAAFKGTDEA